VNAQQDDWDEWLPLVEMAYNNSVQASTGFAPYYLNTGRDMPTYLRRALEHVDESNTPATGVLLQKWEDALQQAKENIEAAQLRQQYWANQHRRVVGPGPQSNRELRYETREENKQSYAHFVACCIAATGTGPVSLKKLRKT